MTDAEQMEASDREEKLRENTVNSLTVVACVCQDCCRGGAVVALILFGTKRE